MGEHPAANFLPRPPEGWTGFAGGTDPNGVPPCPADTPWGYRMAAPAPSCPHGTSYAQPCYSCGWVCPTCKRSYAPWVRECNYRHDDAPVPGPANGSADLAALSLRLPAAMSSPNYQHLSRVSRTWKEIFPGLQCYVQNRAPEKDGTVTLCLRLTPEPGSDDPA